DRLVEEIENEMSKRSVAQDYEEAAILRDRINDIKAISQRQRVSRALVGDFDVVGTAIRGERACIQLFIVRKGNLIGKEVFIENVPFGSSHSEVLTAFVEQRYFGRLDIPSKIVTSHKLIDKKFIKGWLREKKIKASLSMARTEMERDLKKLLIKNAHEKLSMELKLEKIVPSLLELRSILSLETVPERIEGIDISDISGDWAVGSLVSFYQGKPDKRNYRKYRIKAVEGINDYAMIREVVRRRYSRLVNEGGELPNIILIDGGKGHLSSAVEELERLFIDVPVISIAKKREEIFVPECGDPLDIEPKSEGMNLIKQIRDEAHRFAVDYHRKLRRKGLKRSALDEIPGVGPTRRKRLMRHFGSVRKIQAATVKEIAEVNSVGSSLAEEIYRFFHGNGGK
ncbi:MAG: excinuclease ABC subunit UvrC, partial [Candidatus Thermoplasmatota archaeon]|nr:excinuclease ABC subunit UvrC [Candidatus Thermoplasmatota archaeon]